MSPADNRPPRACQACCGLASPAALKLRVALSSGCGNVPISVSKKSLSDNAGIGGFNQQDARRLVESIRAARFPGEPGTFVAAVFRRVADLFAGRDPAFQACDTAFHNLTHTCEATIATARILDGHIASRHAPLLRARDFDLAIAATLLHDTGLLKTRGDAGGTGAKYTLVHVARSAEVAAKLLPPLGVSAGELRVVQLAIHATEVHGQAAKLAFRTARERLLGCAVGTGDMLAQLAAPDYPERLPLLFREFTEAVAHDPARAGWLAAYRTPEDLLRQTRKFFEN